MWLIAAWLLRPMLWMAGRGIGRCVAGGGVNDDLRNWVSKTAGDLLALAPRVAGKPGALRRAFLDNLDSCLRHLFHGNGAEFAKFVGCTATSVYNWRSGKTTPRIDQLLQLSDRLRLPIAAFLLAGRAAGAVDWKVVKPEAIDYAVPSILHRSRSKVRQVLRLLLNERPAPSLREVARRLGYQGTEGLRRVGKSLCKRITNNYKKSFEPDLIILGRDHGSAVVRKLKQPLELPSHGRNPSQFRRSLAALDTPVPALSSGPSLLCVTPSIRRSRTAKRLELGPCDGPSKEPSERIHRLLCAR
jgi:hypothetical protein